MRKLSILWVLLCFVSRVFAQAECPALVEQAVAATGEACMNVERNQACYGNVSLSATFHPEAVDVQFEAAGDIAGLADLQDISLTALDVQEETWGIAVLRVQANLPDTLPGQNVTMLLFGDVQVENAGTLTGVTLTGTVNVNSGANIRRSPSQNGTIIGSLMRGDTVRVIGRLEDASWLQIQLPTSEGTGWVFADLLALDGDVNTLSVNEPGVPVYGPMQAFYFRSGIGDAACAEAPDSGILLQTPQGAGSIVLNVNEAAITLGSTAFLQAEPDGDMIINLLEGGATIETEWDVEFVPAGARVRVPLDEEGTAEVADFTPEPYDLDPLLVLPLSLLPRQIRIARPLVQEEIEVLRATPTPIPPTLTPTPAIVNENWTVTQTVQFDRCGNATNATFGVTLTFDSITRVLLGMNWMGIYFPMTPSGLGYASTYTDQTNLTYNISLTFQADTFFTAVIDFSRSTPTICAGRFTWDGRYP
jgi:uncharacterized protein YraI